MSFRKIRDRINIILYDYKDITFKILNVLHVIVSLSSVGVLIYYYGFKQTEESHDFIFFLLEFSLAFYLIRYTVKLIYDYHPLKYIRKHWLKSFIMLWLLIEGVSFNLFGTLLIEPLIEYAGFSSFGDFSMIFIQIFFLVIIVSQIANSSSNKPWLKVHPALLFTMSILILIFGGALFLMLPEMSNIKGGMGFTDSVFLSSSSVSVTGLSTIDLTTDLTFKGQLVVLALIQLGGLNTIAFGALMLVVARFGVGIKYHEVIEDFVNKDSMLKTTSMFGKILLWTFSIEIIGIICLYFSFGSEGAFADSGYKLYQSIFHGISGFNNAGLSILPNGMSNELVVNNYPVHMIILGLFFLGGFGMIYLFDLFGVQKLRDRMRNPWKNIEFGTKISLYFTVGLLVFGAVVFYLFEYNNTMAGKTGSGKVITALFESMTTRNAGFNTVDTSSLSMPVIILFLFLMFIGASSGSAGGGIRTSTFAILYASVRSTISGKKHTEIFKKTISQDVVMKAYSILIFFILGNVLGIFALAITEQEALNNGAFSFMDLVFEHVSAASTVGLSTGITAELSDGGKYVLAIAMFVGRVGTLTLAYLLSKKVLSTNYKYPTGHTMVG
jgi:Trk-type K+ transport system membrane component